jgi:hypothetical protein
MGVSLYEFVGRARTIAEGRGVDPFKNPIIDAGMTAEALVPHCIRAALSSASAGDVLNAFVEQTINVDANGEGPLPDGVLRNFMDEAYLPDFVHSSHVLCPDYNRSRFNNMLCYFTTRPTANGGAIFKTTCVTSAPITLVVPSVPDMTDLDSDDDIPLPTKVLDAAILTLAGALTGEIKIQDLLGIEANKTQD